MTSTRDQAGQATRPMVVRLIQRSGLSGQQERPAAKLPGSAAR
jgi:hypothetical protein